MSRPSPISQVLPSIQRFKNLSTGSTSTLSVNCYQMGESSSGVSRRKPSGWIPPNPYNFTLTYRRGGEGEFSNTLKNPSTGVTTGYAYTGTVLTTDNLGPYGVEGCSNQALTEAEVVIPQSMLDSAYLQALQKLKGMKVDLGTAFGERKQTANLLGDTATRLARAVRNLRRGNVRNAMRDLGMSTKHRQPRNSNWTNNWLQLQYGWKPLLSDCFGAVDALSKRSGDRWRVTAKGFRSEPLSGFYLVTPSGSSPTGYQSIAKSQRLAFVRIDALAVNDLSQSFASLGVTNPLNVAWELVPYSFVVDWFLPLGNFLNSLDAYLGYDQISICWTKFYRANWEITGVSGKLSNGAIIRNLWSGSKQKVSVIRTVTGKVAPPFPRFKDPRSLGHLANGLSLLAQAFR